MNLDCVVCGETCVDLTVGPVDRSRPLKQLGTLIVDDLAVGTGGIVCNSGMALARMGLRTTAVGGIGDDHWAGLMLQRLRDQQVDVDSMLTIPDAPTSATVILVDSDGEHNFLFRPGASSLLTVSHVRARAHVFSQSRFALFGYFGLWSDEFVSELPQLLAELRTAGCRTAMDAAASGGTLERLIPILPHLDVYIPSYDEAAAQTGLSDPHDMILTFRRYTDQALLGIKLGADGALLSPIADEWVHIAPVSPPGPVVDTTGAGDCFYAGLICGLLIGMPVSDAGRLGAAAGAFSVTAKGAVTALPSLSELLAYMAQT